MTQQRDLAWTTYKLLSSEVAELKVAQAAADSEVRFASPAILPSRPLAQRGLIAGPVLAGLLGLAVGIAIAFVADSLGQAPFLDRRERRRKRVAGLEA